MAQQGQVFPMKSSGPGGTLLWGYRYRTGGRGSRRVQPGGFQSEQDAVEALERALERLRRANGTGTTLTLAGLVDVYLAQHDAQPETIDKLRWLLAKAAGEFGDRRLGELRAQEIAGALAGAREAGGAAAERVHAGVRPARASPRRRAAGARTRPAAPLDGEPPGRHSRVHTGVQDLRPRPGVAEPARPPRLLRPRRSQQSRHVRRTSRAALTGVRRLHARGVRGTPPLRPAAPDRAGQARTLAARALGACRSRPAPPRASRPRRSGTRRRGL